MRSDERPMASEQSRLDAAVEVAVRAFQTDVTPDGNGCVGPHTKMRAALLAAMPVLLGPVVAEWRAVDSGGCAGVWHRCADRIESIYAPDLGGGK